MVGYPINWDANPGNVKLLQSPLYTKYSSLTFGELVDARADIWYDLSFILASQESAEICAYLCWLLRVTELAVL